MRVPKFTTRRLSLRRLRFGPRVSLLLAVPLLAIFALLLAEGFARNALRNEVNRAADLASELDEITKLTESLQDMRIEAAAQRLGDDYLSIPEASENLSQSLSILESLEFATRLDSEELGESIERAAQIAGAPGISRVDQGFAEYTAIIEQVLRAMDSLTLEVADPNISLVREAWDLGVDAELANIDSGNSSFSEGWTAGMADGTFAVLLAPAWMTSFIQDVAPGTAGLWDIAAIPGQGGNWGGSQLVIPQGSDEPELAWDLINYLLSPQGQLQTFELHGNLPSIPELYSEPAIAEFSKEFFNDAPTGQIYVQSALALEPAFVGRHQFTAERVLGTAVEAVGDGRPREEIWDLAVELLTLLEEDDASLTAEEIREHYGLLPVACIDASEPSENCGTVDE